MVNDKQIAALKYLIQKSNDSDELTKKICFLLIERSESLSKSVVISITESAEYSSLQIKQVSEGISGMNNPHGTTNLRHILKAMDAQCVFSAHCNLDDANDRYCIHIWLSPQYHDIEAEKVAFTVKEIELVALDVT
jgi:hypothetical protein